MMWKGRVTRTVGSTVVEELLRKWSVYRDRLPVTEH